MGTPSSPAGPQQPPRQPQRRQHDAQRPGQQLHAEQPLPRSERGVPDGVIVGVLGVLLGTTALVWAATELGGLVSHGRFPRPLPFLSTATAIRHLATAPNDLAGAWPGTPSSALPSPAAFWLTFFALLALALLLLLSAATARAKHRVAHRAAARAAALGQDVAGLTPVGAPLTGHSPHGGPPQQRRAPGSAPAGPEGPDHGVPDSSTSQFWGGSAASGPTDAFTGPRPASGPVAVPGAGAPVTGGQGAALPGGAVAAGAVAGPAFPVPGVPGPAVPAPEVPGAGVPHHGTQSSKSLWATSPTAATLTDLTAVAPGDAPAAGASVPRPGGATAVGWARGSARAERPVTLRFTLPPTGTVCVFAPEAGSAARRALVGAVVADATSGPLVVVTADGELWDARPPHRRAERFDPQQLTAEDTETPRGRWAPHSGCAEPVVAAARARALLLSTLRPVAGHEEQTVRGIAETLLRCWLRAAALDGRPFRHVARWAGGGSGAGRQEAVAVLQSAATPTDVGAGEEPWAGQLQAALLRPASVLDAALGRIRAALGAVAELHVLAACTPESPAAALDPETLLQDGAGGSLYVFGRSGDSRLREPGSGATPAAHSAMPLLSALVDDVVQRAWHASPQKGSAQPVPGLLLVLDDIAAVAPFPTLPQLMADGSAQGLRAFALLRSPEQARARWGERAVHSLWTSADHRAILGPLSPAPLAALLASVGAAEHAPQPGLAEDELLLLPGRHRSEPPQRFRITAAGA